MMGIGAQFGGKYFCHDVRVVRLPRHGASCPVGLGVSCSADRQVGGHIVFIPKNSKVPYVGKRLFTFKYVRETQIINYDFEKCVYKRNRNKGNGHSCDNHRGI